MTINNQAKAHLEKCRCIFVKDYLCSIRIGVHPHEKHQTQKIRLNVKVYLSKQYASPKNDLLKEVYDYDTLMRIIIQESNAEEIQLQETLCSNIAKAVLKDKRITAVSVSSEKLEAYKECESVGVQILEFQD